MRPTVGIKGRYITHPSHIPKPDGGLDVGDSEPRRRLIHSADQEEVPPARTVKADVLEGEGRLCSAPTTASLDFATLEHSVDEESTIIFAAGARRLA